MALSIRARNGDTGLVGLRFRVFHTTIRKRMLRVWVTVKIAIATCFVACALAAKRAQDPLNDVHIQPPAPGGHGTAVD